MFLSAVLLDFESNYTAASLRFCNDQDAIDGSVKFGFVTRKIKCVRDDLLSKTDADLMNQLFSNTFSTGANDNAGISLGMIGPCEIGFKSVAFDTAGGLPYTFATPLIKPSGGPLIEQPTGNLD